MQRCAWCGEQEIYVRYHDEEWGVAVHDDQALFERLVLEGMQAGLSWITVLNKRAHMQQAFYGFDMHKLARAGDADLATWMDDAGLIRHRGKLQAMVVNAQQALAMDDFSGFLWQFAPVKAPAYRRMGQVPAHTPESSAMSKALKKQGFKFVGPTTCYAFMQSVGMVNDHLTSCFRHAPCQPAR